MDAGSCVYSITMNEVERATQTLIAAFEEDDYIRFVCGTGESSIPRKHAFFSSIIKYCIRYGKAYRTANFESVACRKLPGDTRFTLWRMFRSGMLKLPAVLGKEKFSQFLCVSEKLDELVARQMAGRNYLYCLTLGTQPDKQRQGFGGQVMRETFDFARSLGVPCYLPTFTLSALSAHQHNGYVELESHHFAEYGLTVYCMLNELEHTSG